MSRFKSPTQPLCRCCGKPIPKHAVGFYVEEKLSDFQRSHNERGTWSSRYIEGHAKNRAEAQRLSNTTIISLRYSGEGEDRHVRYFTTWDGETYKDAFFCNSTDCAVRYAYMIVQSPNNTIYSKAYVEAMEVMEARAKVQP